MNKLTETLKPFWNKNYAGEDLRSNLKLLNEDELRTIYETLDYPREDTIKREDLIHLLSTTLYSQLYREFTYFNHNHFNLIANFLKNFGEVDGKKISLPFLFFLKKTALAFPVIKGGKQIMLMSPDIMKLFMDENMMMKADYADKNSRVVKYAYGFIKLYGIAEIGYFTKKFNGFEKTNLGEVHIRKVLNYESLLNLSVTLDKDFFCKPDLLKRQDRLFNKKLSYYPFAKDEFLAGKASDDKPDTEALFNHIKALFNPSDVIIRSIIKELLDELANEHTAADAVDRFQNHYKIQSVHDRYRMIEILDTIRNSLRLYSLKGYKRSELDKH